MQQFGRKYDLDTTEEASIEHDEPSLMSTSVPISMPVHARNMKVNPHLDDSFEVVFNYC